MTHDAFDYLFKVILVGDAAVGKTSLTNRFAYGTYTEGYVATLGVDFIVKSIKLDNFTVKLQAWDTAGQERYAGVRPIYFRGARGAVLVFEVSKRQSFVNAEKWLGQIRRYSGPGVPVVLVGNKVDLVDQREVAEDEVKMYASQKGMPYIETSAKTDHNVTGVFQQIARLILTEELSREQVVQ